MKILKIVLLSLVCLGIGIGAGFYLAGKKILPGPNNSQKAAKKEKSGKKILFYRNPMNPSVTSPVPKKDDMGMDYVPVYEGGGAENGPAGTVRIDPVVEQNIGVRTGTARVMQIGRIIRTYGRIAYDEDNIFSVHPRFKGWIDRVRVTKTGDMVKAGQILATIYSPELVSTQQDYLLALKAIKQLSGTDIDLIRNNSQALLKSARKRLKLFGISDIEIAGIENTGRPVTSLAMRSSVRGTVMKITARQGIFVTPSSELYRIADLSRVWVIGEVYDTDFPWLEVGNNVNISFPGAPGRSVTGQVEFIYPYEQKKKRTVQVRMVFDNNQGFLKPGMFVNVTIDASPRRVLVVPSEAIIRSGTRQMVFIRKAAGRYEPRIVGTGLESEGYTEITSGLTPGEAVVISAQFLIDSESSLREAVLKMTAPKKDGNALKMKMGTADDKGNN